MKIIHLIIISAIILLSSNLLVFGDKHEHLGELICAVKFGDDEYHTIMMYYQFGYTISIPGKPLIIILYGEEDLPNYGIIGEIPKKWAVILLDSNRDILHASYTCLPSDTSVPVVEDTIINTPVYFNTYDKFGNYIEQVYSAPFYLIGMEEYFSFSVTNYPAGTYNLVIKVDNEDVATVFFTVNDFYKPCDILESELMIIRDNNEDGRESQYMNPKIKEESGLKECSFSLELSHKYNIIVNTVCDKNIYVDYSNYNELKVYLRTPCHPDYQREESETSEYNLESFTEAGSTSVDVKLTIAISNYDTCEIIQRFVCSCSRRIELWINEENLYRNPVINYRTIGELLPREVITFWLHDLQGNRLYPLYNINYLESQSSGTFDTYMTMFNNPAGVYYITAETQNGEIIGFIQFIYR